MDKKLTSNNESNLSSVIVKLAFKGPVWNQKYSFSNVVCLSEIFMCIFIDISS